jgi:separase
MGPMLAYLLNGAPWALGNLWDVTDRDIDKLSVQCMETMFRESLVEDISAHGSLSSSLCRSRNTCKLQCAVGFAPVIYGLPIPLEL